MNREEEKAEYEKGVFLKFLERAELDIDRDSIRSGDHVKREPDFLCKTNKGSELGFEIGRLIDPILMEVQKCWNPQNGEYVRTKDHSGEIAKRKLKKSYLVDCPVELLLYSEFPNGTPESMILERVGPMSRSLKHEYVRVWFMGKEICMLYESNAANNRAQPIAKASADL